MKKEVRTRHDLLEMRSMKKGRSEGATRFAAGIGKKSQLLLTCKEKIIINEGVFERERGRRPGRKRQERDYGP